MKRLALLGSAALLFVVLVHGQEAMIRNGRPALRFSSKHGPSFVEDAGKPEPTLRFSLFSLDNDNGGCKEGWLYISATRVSWEPKCGRSSFESARIDLRPYVDEFDLVSVRIAGRKRVFGPRDPDGKPFRFGSKEMIDFLFGSKEMIDFLVRSLRDFPSANEEFERLTTSLRATVKIVSQPGNAQVSLDGKVMGTTDADRGELTLESVLPGLHSVRVTAAGYKDWTQSITLTAGNTSAIQAKLASQAGQLSLVTQPGNVGIYVDEEFKGISSAEGRLVVSNLTPGSHRLRFTVIGYKELAQSLDLTAGETKTVEAELEPAGPKPLALAEIEEALANGLPPKGITKLVNQYGVDFALTKEVEQRLRDKGADSDLLVAVATGKK
jgi:hypothetical protein